MFKKKINIFKIDKLKVESHLETFLKFFTVEVFAGLLILLITMFWFNFIGGEAKIINFKYYLRANLVEKKSNDIVVITLTDDEYDTLKTSTIYSNEFQNMQKYTYPRKYLINLLEKLERSNPKLIAIDIILDVKSTSSDLDSQLTQTFLKYDNLVFCSNFSTWHVKEITPLKQYWDPKKHVVGHAKLVKKDGKNLYINHLVPMDDGQVIPSFALTSYLRYKGFRSNISVRSAVNNQHKSLLDSLSLPFSLEEMHSLQFISYSNIIKENVTENYEFGFNTYNSSMVLQGIIPEKWLTNKIVLIGGAYEASNDFGVTPFDKENNFKPGVFLHASLLEDLISNYYIKKINTWFVVFICLSIIFLISYIFYQFRLAIAILLSALIVLMFCVFNLKIFVSEHSYYFPLELPLVFFFFFVLFMIFISFYKEESTLSYLQSIWGPYVPSERLQSIIELTKSKAIKTGAVGKAEIITMLYVRFDGFDNILPSIDDEKLEKHDYTAQIKTIDYILDILKSEVVFLKRYLGASERFLGNSIVFYFGIPVGDLNDKKEALRAILCAWELRDKFLFLKNKSLKLKNHFPDLKIQIFAHTGGIVVGAVRNLESRIEPTLLTKMFEEIYTSLSVFPKPSYIPDIIITGPTYSMVHDFVLVEDINVSTQLQMPFKLHKVNKLNKIFDDFQKLENVFKELDMEGIK